MSSRRTEKPARSVIEQIFDSHEIELSREQRHNVYKPGSMLDNRIADTQSQASGVNSKPHGGFHQVRHP